MLLLSLSFLHIAKKTQNLQASIFFHHQTKPSSRSNTSFFKTTSKNLNLNMMSTIRGNKMDAMHSIKNKIDPNTGKQLSSLCADISLYSNTDQSAKFDVFTEEHQIFLAYTKRYLHQQRVHFRFEATFPNLAEPHTVGAFIGMYVSRWAPVQNPGKLTPSNPCLTRNNKGWLGVMDIEQYTWGTELLDEFELK